MAIETLRNNSILEIIGSTGIKVVAETIDPGEANERKRFTISGKVKLNKPKTIGTLELTASDVKRFIKSPNISKVTNRNIQLNSSLRLSLNSVQRNANNNITSYLYDLIYIGKENVGSSNTLDYILSNRTSNLITRKQGIVAVNVGRNKLNKEGEDRKIEILGIGKCTFQMCITKLQNEISDQMKSRYSKAMISQTEVDILNWSKRSGYVTGYGINAGEYGVLKTTLNNSGVFSFYQNFPKVTNADIITSGLGNYAIHIKPFSDSNSTTIIQNEVAFQSMGWRKNVKGWQDGWWTKFLHQKANPKLTLRATSNSVLYTINSQIIPDGASSQTYDIIYRGNKNKNKTKVKYILKALSSSHSFSVAKTGVFSDTGHGSDWSNAQASANGGCVLNIRNYNAEISTSYLGHTNDTCVITFNIDITRYPDEDLIVSAALNTFVTCS